MADDGPKPKYWDANSDRVYESAVRRPYVLCCTPLKFACSLY